MPKYTVLRHMDGDRPYAAGETRELSEADAAHLVRLGVLAPAGQKADQPAEDKAEPSAADKVAPVTSDKAALSRSRSK